MTVGYDAAAGSAITMVITTDTNNEYTYFGILREVLDKSLIPYKGFIGLRFVRHYKVIKKLTL